VGVSAAGLGMSEAAPKGAQTPRRLTTVLAADICGYSRLAEADEAAAVKTVQIVFAVFEKAVRDHRGRVFNRAGDGFMAEFPSVADGLQAALAFTAGIKARDTLSPNNPQASARVGLHAGDVIEQPDGDLLGHGVNIAARLQAEAEPGGVLVSLHAVNLVRGKIEARFRRRGPLALKNIDEAVVAFDVEGGAKRHLLALPPRFKKAVAVHRRKIVVLSLACLAIPIAAFVFGFSGDRCTAQNHGKGNVRTNIALSRFRLESSAPCNLARLKQIIVYLESSNDPVDAQAFSQIVRGNVNAAIRILEQKYEANKATLSTRDKIALLRQLGTLNLDEQPKKAQGYFEAIADLEPTHFEANMRLGELNYAQSDHAGADENFRKARAVGAKYIEDSIYIDTSHAASLIIEGEVAEARKLLADAAQRARKLGLDSLVSRAESRLAWSYWSGGETEKARQMLLDLEQLQKRKGFDRDLAMVLSLLGSTALQENNLDEALDYFEQTLELEQRNGRALGIADTKFYIGLIHVLKGSTAEASAAFKEGLTIARANEMKNMMIKNYVGLAHVAKAEGEPERACEQLRRGAALDRDKSITYLPQTVELISRLGCNYPPLEMTAAN